MMMNTSEYLYSQIRDLLLRAKQHSVYQINTLMVRTYFEIGRFIVEHEQQGKERAAYGKQTLDELAQKLSAEFGKGFSTVNLRQMRLFYTTYQIQQTLSAELQTPDFQLSWSHYLKLMRMKDTYLGQMQMYVNYYDRSVKLPDENKTVGIVLCRDKSETLVEYTLPEDNEQIFASRYLTILPDKKALEAQLKGIHL
jgi:hypothetical protein